MSEFIHEHEMSYENHEHFLALDLLSYLHGKVETAQKFQIGLEQAARSVDEPLHEGNAAINYSHEGGEVLMPHKRIVLGPAHRQPVIDKIEAVVLRAPVTHDDDNPTEPQTGRSRDLFLEVWSGKRRPYYYLLNSQGLVRYRSAEDIIESVDYEATGDLYQIEMSRRLPPKISAGLLHHALREYVFRPQTNDPRPPFYT